MEQITRIGMDTSKHIFQLHGVTAAEEPALRKKLRRKEMVRFFEKLAPTVIAIEACGASHHWARLLQSFGHSVKLIAPQLVKPYVKRGKNDTANAEALCEATSRPRDVKSFERRSSLPNSWVHPLIDCVSNVHNRHPEWFDDPLVLSWDLSANRPPQKKNGAAQQRSIRHRVDTRPHRRERARQLHPSPRRHMAQGWLR